MRRRVFITLLGSAAIWPFAARAQKSESLKRVGVIMGFAENDEVWQAYLSTFRQALQNLGWTEGRNIRFDYRFSGESEERMHRMADEIAALAPAVKIPKKRRNSSRPYFAPQLCRCCRPGRN